MPALEDGAGSGGESDKSSATDDGGLDEVDAPDAAEEAEEEDFIVGLLKDLELAEEEDIADGDCRVRRTAHACRARFPSG